MTEKMDNRYIEDSPEDNPMMNGYLMAQAMLDRFVAINYEAATDAALLHTGGKGIDAGHIKQQIVDVIRNNPSLVSMPTYFNDGRANYLWYSDFYDDAGEEVFKAYKQFASRLPKITPVNYKTELAKIDLPYFKELVDLISLEKLYQEAERRLVAAGKQSVPDETAPMDIVEEATPDMVTDAPQSEPAIEQPKPKRSYEPKLNNEQYSLLAECVEKIKLFRRPVTVTQLKKLFTGRLAEPLQVMNQLPLVYLLDEMRGNGYIKKAWMTAAFENRDFISFRRGKNVDRYGAEPHYLTMNQLKSRRTDSKHCYIDGGDEIDDAIEQMKEFDLRRA